MSRMGLSLITLDALDESTAANIRRAADAGYEGVEFVHFLHQDMDVEAVRNAIEETGLEPLGVQVDLHDLLDGISDIVTQYEQVGVSTLVFHVNDENWTERRARDTVELVRRRALELDEHGWDLLVHPNHMDLAPIIDWPVARHIPWLGIAARLDRLGVLEEGPVHHWLALNESRFSKGFNILLDHYWHRRGMDRDTDVDDLEETMLARYLALDSELVKFEIDVAFLPIRGYDPVAVLEYLGDRVQSVHVKDIDVDNRTLGRWPEWCGPGDGQVDLTGVVETAIANDVRWLTFEHDTDEDPTGTLYRGVETIAPALKREQTAND
jgi:sugar phosphate isomerase/epimerase